MKQSLIDLWTEALTDGSHEQATGTLRDGQDGGYCCIGVLCDIARNGEWEKNEFLDDEHGEQDGQMDLKVLAADRYDLSRSCRV